MTPFLSRIFFIFKSGCSKKYILFLHLLLFYTLVLESSSHVVFSSSRIRVRELNAVVHVVTSAVVIVLLLLGLTLGMGSGLET